MPVTAPIETNEAIEANEEEETWRNTYQLLRGIASRHLFRQRTRGISATTLVHEAYLRLAQAPHLRMNDRAHYLRTASRAMSWILVDRTRESFQEKRGGGLLRVPLDDSFASGDGDSREHETRFALEEAVGKLYELDARSGNVVVMRSEGMRLNEIALLLGISTSTVRRDWAFGIRWLGREISNLPSRSPRAAVRESSSDAIAS